MRLAGICSGAAALLWFLVRVIPKPSRKAYPCQRAAFPVASGFVLWLCGVLAIKSLPGRVVSGFRRHRVTLSCPGAVAILGAVGWTLMLQLGSGVAAASAFKPANEAVGTTESAYVPPFDAAAAGLTPLFDGKTLKGWVGNPEFWKVSDGAIIGVKDNQNLMTADDYDDFRLILSTIQVKEPSNHQGVGFWGKRLPEGTWGYGGCLVIMPPMNWMWDYTRNSSQVGTMTLSRNLEKELGLKRSQWTQAEILVNRSKGTVRMAVDGIEVVNYTDSDPGRWRKGPIGLQAHGGNKEVRYKDIFIEVSPKEDRLITLKK